LPLYPDIIYYSIYFIPYLIEKRVREFVEEKVGRVYDVTRLDSLETDTIVYRARVVGDTGLLWYKIHIYPFCGRIVGLYSEENREMGMGKEL